MFVIVDLPNGLPLFGSVACEDGGDGVIVNGGGFESFVKTGSGRFALELDGREHGRFQIGPHSGTVRNHSLNVIN